MILYCDTSALVKLYLVEDNSDSMRHLLAKAEAAATCRISWVEAFAAMARRVRESAEDNVAIDMAHAALGRDWPRYLVLELTQEMVELAATYAETFAMRAYDSVQLAGASLTRKLSAADVVFACFDRRLNQAAQILGLRTPFVG